MTQKQKPDFPLASFQSVSPWRTTERSTHHRHLPHIEIPQATYFITFRCHNELILKDEHRDIVFSAVCYWDGIKLDLDAAVVMPDHVHMIFRITDQLTLGNLLHSIKSYSAQQVNKALKRTGPFWLNENFDHIIRHEDEWNEKLEYVKLNPVTAGIVEFPEDYRWLFLRKVFWDW